MIMLIHKDCGNPAFETPDVIERDVPTGFPFTCIHCLEEIEDMSDLQQTVWMSQ